MKLVAATLVMTAASAIAQDIPGDLHSLRDHYRTLLIFAPSHDSRVEEQWSQLVDNRAAAKDRQLVTVLLTKSLTKMHDGNRPQQASFSQEKERRLRLRFNVQPGDFTVILIGKDGGEKLRSARPMPWQTLQSTIDAMPMRQQEMHSTPR